MTLLAREIAVVLVKQHLDLALRVASRAYVLDRGKVACSSVSEVASAIATASNSGATCVSSCFHRNRTRSAIP
jgi:ABC-type branched-subunit amino acid transport system ATPase component